MKVQPSAVLVLLVLQIQQVFLRNPGYIKREALVDVMRGAPESIDIRIINYSNTTLLNPTFHDDFFAGEVIKSPSGKIAPFGGELTLRMAVGCPRGTIMGKMTVSATDVESLMFMWGVCPFSYFVISYYEEGFAVSWNMIDAEPPYMKAQYLVCNSDNSGPCNSLITTNVSLKPHEKLYIP